jgi:hypothetical protein
MSTARAVTERHIREMQHAIGLDYKRPKRGKYEAYRNYCMCGSPNEIWEHLVSIGYADCKFVENDGLIPPKSYWYSLTQDGLDFMGAITGCKITLRS